MSKVPDNNLLAVVVKETGINIHHHSTVFSQFINNALNKIMKTQFPAYPGLEKTAIWSCGTSKISFSIWESYFLFSLAQWAKDQQDICQINLQKSKRRLAQGKQNL